MGKGIKVETLNSLSKRFPQVLTEVEKAMQKHDDTMGSFVFKGANEFYGDLEGSFQPRDREHTVIKNGRTFVPVYRWYSFTSVLSESKKDVSDIRVTVVEDGGYFDDEQAREERRQLR